MRACTCTCVLVNEQTFINFKTPHLNFKCGVLVYDGSQSSADARGGGTPEGWEET